MSTTDDNAPATKRDLKNLQQDIDAKFKSIDGQFESIDERFKSVDVQFKSVDVQFQTVMKYIRAEAEETRRHFDVVAEDIKHDFKGAFHDRAVQLR
ncbi:hypothetical protein HYT95_01355 [Candidatus Peregrinibacteria bacterium]|nr:hypothetical protein [Candidatus Peregrinibacteria bacterium]